MRCPKCDATENRVVDTRASRGGRAVRRRRECTVCATRFTTYEYVEERVAHTVHSRRRRTARPPRLALVSTTRFSVASHSGHLMPLP